MVSTDWGICRTSWVEPLRSELSGWTGVGGLGTLSDVVVGRDLEK